MVFSLYQHAIGPNQRLDISEDRYKNISGAWSNLMQMLYIEEDWDCALQNYFEVESTILTSALYGMMFSRPTVAEYQDTRLSYARRLANLLSSCKSYLDHTPSNLKKMSPIGQEFEKLFTEATKKSYDNHFGYRFMEALRNHAQHKGLPLHGAAFSSKWIDRPQGDAMSISASATIDVSRIREAGKFKSSVLAEIPNDKKSIDVATAMREYLEGLGLVHNVVRASVAETMNKAAALIRETIAEFEQLHPNNKIGLNAAEFGANGKILKRTPILDDPLLRLEHLQQKNSSLVNLRRRFVSNELKV